MSKQMFPLPLSALEKWLRAPSAAERIAGPTTVRVLEEQIATIDESGNRRTVIRIRTFAMIEGPTGPVEIERDCRHTLPGFGHVYPIAENEYMVFRDRIRLRVDPDVAVARQQRISANAPRPSEQGLEHVPVQAPAIQGHWRRNPFPLYAIFALVLLTIAVWMPNPRHEPPPLQFTSLTPAISSDDSAPTPPQSLIAASSSTLLLEFQPKALPTGITSVNRDTAAYRSVARLALAVRPEGVVYINGKRTGLSPPMKQLALKPGRYNVEIRNDAFQPHRQSIDLRRTAKVTIVHDFSTAAKAAPTKAESSLAFTSRPYPRFLSEEWPR